MNLGGVELRRAPQADLATMRPTGRGKRFFSNRQAGAGAFGDRGTFHFRDLRQHCNDQCADAGCDPTKATDLKNDPLLHQQTHCGLDVQCVAA